MNGVKKHTRDVGVIFPTPSLSEVKVEEDSDVTSWSEEKVEEKKLLTRNLGDKKLRKNKQSCCEGQFLIPGFIAEKLCSDYFFLNDPVLTPSPPPHYSYRVIPAVKQTPGHHDGL